MQIKHLKTYLMLENLKKFQLVPKWNILPKMVKPKLQLGRTIILIAALVFVQCDANSDEFKFVENYWSALDLSQKEGKPIFLYFTTYTLSYDEFRYHFATSKKIQNKLNKDFITVLLHVDTKTKLSESDIEKIKRSALSEEDKKAFLGLKNKGQVNALLQRKIFQSNVQPLYVLIDSDGQILVEPFGYIKKDKTLFLNKLNEGLRKWDENYQ